jgi:flavin reductase (DIM6/NTAB) family NADH-FMN oxidoreductase RutF
MIEAETTMPAPQTVAEQLRNGLRRLGKAVVVITCWHEERRWAMTATAVSELSMDPPSLLVCVNKNASLYAPLAAGANFCVNILQADQLAVSRACSGGEKGEARFREGRWGAGICGTPYLREAQASFICEHETHIEYGTHAVVIGAVKNVECSGEVDPLIYLDGAYARAIRLSEARG